jgi:hypothetical protein
MGVISRYLSVIVSNVPYDLCWNNLWGTNMPSAADWYADPWGQAPMRWWDGVQWTAWTQRPEGSVPDSTPEVRDAIDQEPRPQPAGGPAELLGEPDPRGRDESLSQDKLPWERSKFERSASGSGIAFERNDLVTHGQALLACDSWAACVIMSDATADGLDPKDDSALWGAIARHHASPKPLLVNLPSFGGDGTTQEIRQTHSLLSLASHAAIRAKSFNPGDDDDADDEDDYIPENPRAFWIEHPPYYRRFLKERVPRILWLDQLRARLETDLLHEVVADSRDERPTAHMKVQRWGVSGVIVTNELGGRVGKMRDHPILEARERKGHGGYLDFLLLANEFDRPSAVATLANDGIEMPFDPTPGWLNASVEPGLHGWLTVYWSGNIVGLNLKPELARFHIQSGELTVFAPRLAKPIEMLLKRVGQRPTRVLVEPHPGDPECFFGIDILTAAIAQTPDQRPPRKLRHEAREVLPTEWADQLEKIWSSKQSQIDVPPGLFWDEEPQLAWGPPVKGTGVPATGSCRLCGWSSPTKPYCANCSREATEGLFNDRGFDEDWNGAVIWALQTLAEIEFGGPPALSQLKKLPADGPNSDLLMLCRMLTSRRGWTEMGSQRKAYAWTDWLAEAGLLTEGIRTSRGITVMAKDGHLCRSLLERQIDDFFYDHGIAHEPEPPYPFDPEMNVGGCRADWKLSDGTFVEALGFINDSVYMEKAERKIKLAARHQIPVITLNSVDIANLPFIFAKWLPAEDGRPIRTELPPRPEPPTKRKSSTALKNGQNEANALARAERLDRCRQAVELQAGGAARKQIAEQLRVCVQVVKSLLRDGKFYANPQSDPDRLKIVKDAAAARKQGLTRLEFRDSTDLTSVKVDEVWKDADVLFGRDAGAEPYTRE